VFAWVGNEEARRRVLARCARRFARSTSSA
jgi:hypothetical protein